MAIQKYASFDEGGGYAAPKLKAPTLTPAQTTSINSYQQPATKTSLSSFSSSPAPYIAPVQNYQPPAPINQPGWEQQASAQGTGGGGGGGDTTGGASAAAIEPPRPVMPDYNSWTEDQVAAGDSAFMDQRSMYQNKLQKYIADYEAQAGNNAYGQDYGGADFLSKWSAGSGGGRMGGDYRMASQGVGRNREMGLTNVAEDFASRGMANSGLYADSFQKAIEGYNRQKQGLDSATTGQVQDLSFRRGNFEGDTTAGVQSARRDAIGRLMQNFNLTGGA